MVTRIIGRQGGYNGLDETKKAQSKKRVSDSKSVVMIESDDVQDEIDYWSSAVVCYVVGANPPFPVMEGFFNRVWGKLGIDTIAGIGRGMFIFRFTSMESCLKANSDGF